MPFPQGRHSQSALPCPSLRPMVLSLHRLSLTSHPTGSISMNVRQIQIHLRIEVLVIDLGACIFTLFTCCTASMKSIDTAFPLFHLLELGHFHFEPLPVFIDSRSMPVH